MTDPTDASLPLTEATQVAIAAVGLSGGEVAFFTRHLIERLAAGEITGDEATATIVGPFTAGYRDGSSQRRADSDEKAEDAHLRCPHRHPEFDSACAWCAGWREAWR